MALKPISNWKRSFLIGSKSVVGQHFRKSVKMICLNLPFYFSEIVESEIPKRKSTEIDYYLIKSLMISIQTGILKFLNFFFNFFFAQLKFHSIIQSWDDTQYIGSFKWCPWSFSRLLLCLSKSYPTWNSPKTSSSKAPKSWATFQGKLKKQERVGFYSKIFTDWLLRMRWRFCAICSFSERYLENEN